MNAYIILFVSIGLIVGLMFYIVPFELFFISGIGAGAVMIGYIVIFFIMYPKMYPVKIRALGERFDGFSVTDDSRAKVVRDRKKGLEYLELPSGKRFKMVKRKFLMRGNNAVYADIFDTKDQQFPIAINMDKAHLDKVKKEIIPEEQRVWFVKKMGPEIDKLTDPPKDRTHQVLVLGSIMSVIILLVMTMLFYPTYAVEMEKISNAKIGKLNAEWESVRQMYEKGVIDVNCDFGDTIIKTTTEPPTPPPG